MERRGQERRKARDVASFLEAFGYLLPSLFFFVIFVFIPLFRTVRLSMYTTDPIGRLAAFAGLAQFTRILSDPKFIHSIIRTIVFALYTVPATLAASMVLALLGTVRLRRIALFRMLLSSPIAVSAATASLIFVSLYHPALGALNYLLGVAHVGPVPWLVSESTARGREGFFSQSRSRC